MIAYLDGDRHRYSIQVASASHSGRRSSNEDAMGLMDLIIDTIEARNATSSGVAGGIKDFFKSLLGG